MNYCHVMAAAQKWRRKELETEQRGLSLVAKFNCILEARLERPMFDMVTMVGLMKCYWCVSGPVLKSDFTNVDCSTQRHSLLLFVFLWEWNIGEDSGGSYWVQKTTRYIKCSPPDESHRILVVEALARPQHGDVRRGYTLSTTPVLSELSIHSAYECMIYFRYTRLWSQIYDLL